MPRKASLKEASAAGELEGLEALRDRLSDALDEVPPYAMAQLAGRHADVLRRIGELRAAEAEKAKTVEAVATRANEIAVKRAERAKKRAAS